MDSVERQRILAARLLPLSALDGQVAKYIGALKAWRAAPQPGAGDMRKSVYDPEDVSEDAYRVEHKDGFLDIGEL